MTRFVCGLWRAVGAAALVLTLTVAPTAQAAGVSLRPALKDLAKDLKAFLDGKQETALAVGDFSGPPNFPSSSGPGVKLILSEELTSLGIQVKTRHKVAVKGEYVLKEVPDEADATRKVLGVVIKASVVDAFGNTLVDTSYERKVTEEADVVQMTGAPVAIPADATARERDQHIRQAYADPKTDVKGTRIAAGGDGKYAVEIVVDGKPAAPKVDDGLAFVPIARHSTYAVRLINDTDFDAAVTLTIDGLSVFAFSEVKHQTGPKAGQPLYTVYLVPPRKSLLVPGWHKTNERSDQFLVTEFAKGAGALVNQTAGVGTITATFAAAWEGDAAPPDEPAKRRSAGRDATGFGPPVETKLKEVQRTVGAVRASVSVRYTK